MNRGRLVYFEQCWVNAAPPCTSGHFIVDVHIIISWVDGPWNGPCDPQKVRRDRSFDSPCFGRQVTTNSTTNSLKTLADCFIERPSSYRAVNTFHLGHKNQSVYAVRGTSRCLFSDKYKT